ncbi:DUF6221 family protein [Streptomyces sp. SBC-4]|nr:DUF6221 family protein [Streptomyces sp. SBC-4]MDV5145918.1 DUF6221 family protein [Streptomyces sp. SBC-4]
MDDLIAFLRARLDEDAAAARAAAWDEDMSARWTAASSPYGGDQDHPRWYVNDAYDDGVLGKVDPQGNDDEGVARHIARHDPARVLHTTEGLRALLQRYAEPESSPDLPDSLNRLTANVERQVLAVAFQYLALPYADHPDYRAEWRP